MAVFYPERYLQCSCGGKTFLRQETFSYLIKEDKYVEEIVEVKLICTACKEDILTVRDPNKIVRK